MEIRQLRQRDMTFNYKTVSFDRGLFLSTWWFTVYGINKSLQIQEIYVGILYVYVLRDVREIYVKFCIWYMRDHVQFTWSDSKWRTMVLTAVTLNGHTKVRKHWYITTRWKPKARDWRRRRPSRYKLATRIVILT